MPEIQTRNEHSRSLEDAEKFRAIQTLTELGLLTSVKDSQLYHGRAIKEGEIKEEWSVDPLFDNGVFDNVNDRSTLYATDQQVASEFAANRANIKKAPKAAIYKIFSEDADATIIDANFEVSSLNNEDRERYEKALQTLAPPITEGSPVPFEAQNDIDKVFSEIEKLNMGVIPYDKVEEISKTLGIDHKTIAHIVGGYNSRQIASRSPAYLSKVLLHNTDGIILETIDVGDGPIEVPLSIDYLEKFFRDAHIVGVKRAVNTATLGKEIDTVSFIDLDKVNSRRGIDRKRENVARNLGNLAAKIDQISLGGDISSRPEVVKLLNDPHSKPANLVEAAKKVPGFKTNFESQSGNKERFTLQEHTETVLRNFEENFADMLPVELVGPVKLMLLAHDLGKPEAVAAGQKHREKQFNIAHASNFFQAIGLPDSTSRLLLSIIGDGTDLATQAYIFNNQAAATKLRVWAKNSLETSILSKHQVSSADIDGYITLCKLLVTCDGGAYTSMATTRRGSQSYRNYPSFNSSFARPHSLGKRDLKLAVQGEPRAPKDLAPRLSR